MNTVKESVCVREALAEATQVLQSSNFPDARRDAELILRTILGWDRARLLAHPEVLIPERLVVRFWKWVQLRAQHYPIQYLRGFQEFYGRSFRVGPGVFIPRPETEVVVESGLVALRHLSECAPLILEIGTGSGCIAATMAQEIPGARVIATDISLAALKVARSNAVSLGCEQRISFLAASSCRSFRSAFGRFDLIISNPPYLRPDDPLVDVSVRRFEPAGALFAGPTGLELYTEILADGAGLLRPKGRLVVELGYDMLAQFGKLASRLGWTIEAVAKDLSGIDRSVTLHRSLCEEPGNV